MTSRATGRFGSARFGCKVCGAGADRVGVHSTAPAAAEGEGAPCAILLPIHHPDPTRPDQPPQFLSDCPRRNPTRPYTLLQHARSYINTRYYLATTLPFRIGDEHIVTALTLLARRIRLVLRRPAKKTFAGMLQPMRLIRTFSSSVLSTSA